MSVPSVPPKAGSPAPRCGCQTATCVRPVKVRVGLTDGLMTEVAEVIKDKLTPEADVVIGENDSALNREGTVNPFGPQSVAEEIKRV